MVIVSNGISMRWIAIVLPLILATPAAGSDGVLEINQTCALSSAGCFPGDAGGSFPVTIANGGSYRLTGSLSLGASDSAIEVTASQVTIDFAGFAIAGVNSCNGGFTVPVTCSANVAGAHGIVGSGSGVWIHGGSIRGTGDGGIRITGDHARVEDVTVREVGGPGIELGNFARVSRANVLLARGAGVKMGDTSALSDSEIERNEDGVQAGPNGVVTRNRVVANFDLGLDTAQNAVVTENLISRNDRGMLGSSGTVSSNTISENRDFGIQIGRATLTGNLVAGNLDDGIRVGVGAALVGNHVEGNAACGLLSSSGLGNGIAPGLANNVFVGNNTGATCVGGGGQNQISGDMIATSCNVVTCTGGSLKLGTFCPPTTVTCLP